MVKNIEILEGEYLYLVIKEIPAYYCEILKKEGNLIRTTIPKRGSETFLPSLDTIYKFQQNKLENTIYFEGEIKNINRENWYIEIKMIENSFQIHKQRGAIRLKTELMVEIYFLNEENEVKCREKGKIIDLSIIGGCVKVEKIEDNIKNGDIIYVEFVMDKRYITILGEIKRIIKDEEGIKIGFSFLHILPEDEMEIMELTRKLESRL
ncbi:MAG: PilZ domain-containing protein [bacterium]|nr:PilZ domain-containing protein [bacterium]MDW8163676.1 PilZ domain-containing protein [Candidatus Omnitrophota bacterium]